MPLSTNYINSDNNGNEYSQYETNDATTYLAQSRFTPQEKEAGNLVLSYVGVNVATAAAVNRFKMVRYRKLSGVISLIPSTLTQNVDTGMTAADVVVTAVGGDVVLSITGIASATIRHTFKVEKLSSALI